MSDFVLLSSTLGPIVLATGYKRQEYFVRTLFGDEVANRVGPIRGFGDEQGLRNMFVRTGQPGLWLIAASSAKRRVYSRYPGLHIKACREGFIPLLDGSHMASPSMIPHA